MGRDRRLHLVRRHGGTPGEGQQDEERGEPFMQVHCTKTVSIRLGSLFLTLPTRGLTEQNFISSPTRRRLIRSAPRRGRGSRAGRSGRAAWAVFRLMTSSNLSGCSTGPVARPRFPQNVVCGDRREEPTVCRLSAGARWIRTCSTARRQCSVSTGNKGDVGTIF